MDSWFSDIEKLFTNGVTGVDVSIKCWVKLSCEQISSKTDLVHHTAEMGGIDGTTDVELKALF